MCLFLVFLILTCSNAKPRYCDTEAAGCGWLDRLAESTATWYIMTDNCTTVLHSPISGGKYGVPPWKRQRLPLAFPHVLHTDTSTYYAYHITCDPSFITFYHSNVFLLSLIFRFILSDIIPSLCKFNFDNINDRLSRFYAVLVSKSSIVESRRWVSWPACLTHRISIAFKSHCNIAFHLTTS